MRKRLKPNKQDNNLTDNKQRIIETAIENPDWTYSEIADETNLSDGYVGDIHREYIEETIVPEGVDWSDVDEELYEKIVAGLEAREDVIDVKHKYDLSLSQGDSKEVDVAVWTESSRDEILTIIECKFRESRIEQAIVSEVIRNVENSAANMAYIISRNGFQEGAISQAKDAGIALYTLKELEEQDAEGYIQRIDFTVTVQSPDVVLRDISVTPTIEDGYENRVVSVPAQEMLEEQLWDSDLNYRNQTLQDFLQKECSCKDPGIYRKDLNDILINIKGLFYSIDTVNFECTPDSGTAGASGSVDMFEKYDLVMIEELADGDKDNREFYSLKDALTTFVEEVSS